MNDMVRYRLTLLDPCGSPLFAAHAEEDPDTDAYRALVEGQQATRCILDSPAQVDKRAAYSLLVERLP